MSIKLVIIVGMMNVGIILMAPEIIKIFAPVQYYEAVWIIPAVAASVFFAFFYNLFSIIEFYYEKTRFVMYASIFGAVLNIILNYIFIKKYGYIAAGYTTLFCYIIFAVFHYCFANKILKENGVEKIYNTKLIAFAATTVLLFTLLLILVYDYVAIRYLIITAIIACVFIFKDKLKEIIRQI